MNGPSPLLADAILPSLIWIWPITVVLLLPIIVVEAQYARRCLNLMRGQAFRVFAVANVISTVIGFPLATVAGNVLQIKVQNQLYGNPQLNFEQGAVVVTPPILLVVLGSIRTGSCSRQPD